MNVMIEMVKKFLMVFIRLAVANLVEQLVPRIQDWAKTDTAIKKAE